MNIEEIEARVQAVTAGPPSLRRTITLRDIASEDIPYLLAQLKDRDEKLEAVEKLRKELGPEPTLLGLRLDRILHPEEGAVDG